MTSIAPTVALAHRGFSGGTSHALENSAAAFRAAADLGYTWVETDVHATRDGVLIAFHDATLDRTTDRTGAIAELAWSEVAAARIAGREPIATLDELLLNLPGVSFNIDVKAAGAVQPLIECIERHAAHDRVRVTSFSERRRRAVVNGLSRPVRSAPGQTRMTAIWAAAHVPLIGRPWARRLTRGLDALQIPESRGRLSVLTEPLIQAAHAAGVEVHVWTVNDPADMTRLLDLGVDAIVTDRADLLKAVLLERGQWQPARSAPGVS